MKRISAYKHFVLALLAAGLLLAVSGCAWVRDDDADVFLPEGSNFRMSLTVLAPSSAITRAGNHADDGQEDGTAAENYIDFQDGDFRIALFGKDGKYLFALDLQEKWSVYPHATDGDNAVYQMECEIEFPESVSPETIEQLKADAFQVMLLANWEHARANAYAGLFAPAGVPQNLSEIWKDKVNYNFRYVADEGGKSWYPDVSSATRRLIPMFGYAKATKFASRTGSGVLYSNATIKIQRALAKIEVLDQLESQPSLSVDGVTMSAYNTSARFIPDVAANPDWDKIGEQVDASSLPGDVTPASSALTFIHVGNKWIAYVPEMDLKKPSTLNEETKIFDAEKESGRPHLNLTIGSSLSYYEGGEYPVHFAKYDQNSAPTVPDPSWNHILRNHIYRFKVNKVGFKVDLHLHVIPWEPDEEEVWDFTDQVTVQRQLEWSKDTYEQLDENGNVVLWIEEGKCLEGKFKITTPINGRWYARLVPVGEAKTDAVSFVDKEGRVIDGSSACLEISGRIDTDTEFPTVFYIRPTQFGNDIESRFLLKFFVENMGSWMEVPMTDSGAFDYYTIVRKVNIM